MNKNNITTIIIIIIFLAIGFLGFRSIKIEDADKKVQGENTQAQITVSPEKSGQEQNNQQLQITVSPQKEETMDNFQNPVVKTGDLTAEKKLVTISTSKGDIEVELYPQAAPGTVENFLAKAQSGFYNDKTWHRVEDWVVQGGDPLGTGTGGGDMQTELNDLTYKTGSVGIARGQDIRINNDSQFFIVKKDSAFLDKQYTNFGLVTAGMDVVNKIAIGDKITGITVK